LFTKVLVVTKKVVAKNYVGPKRVLKANITILKQGMK